MSSESSVPLDSFVTFGDLLKYLRRRARLTQREVAIAVGYSEAQISRLEQNQRPPDVSALTALFIPALYIEDEPLIVSRLLELAAQARGEDFLQEGIITFSSSVRKEIQESLHVEEIKNNLPFLLTNFIGRENEITEIKNLLASKNRLITLLGTGGSGKTRLAIQIAYQFVDVYENSAWLIELASISNSAHVAQAFLSALGIPEPRDDSIFNALKKKLREKQILLIVDNCEHVLAETAKLVQEILQTCPQVQIIATSREVLTINGEVQYRVPSLLEFDSVNLFVDRAKAVLPTFNLTDENASSITQICSRLDGIPLAIELAAARMTTLSVQEIASRLENSFQLLTGGSTTLARHQTLQAAIDWSYELLSEAEHVLLRRLSVFSGGWTFEAAESVTSDSALVPIENVLDLLSKLVNKSLVIARWESPREARYSMLQTIHDFAHEKLRNSEELESLRARHFNYFLTTAEQAEPRLFTTESSLDWAEAEIDNIRAALTWALEKEASNVPSEERSRQGLELMAYIWPLWLNRGYISEGSEWMKNLLEVHISPTLARARALLIAGDFARARGDLSAQTKFIQESLAIARVHNDKKRIGWALMEMASIEEDLHRYPEAILLLTESLQKFQELNDDLWVCRLSFFLAETHIANGTLEAAKPLFLQGLGICRATNDKWHIALGLTGLGNLERLEGHFLQAREFYAESLNLSVEVMNRVGITYLLQAFAQLNATQGYFEHAAILWGAAEKLYQSVGFKPPSLRERLYTSLISAAYSHLGEYSFTKAWNHGRAMKMQEAVEFALTNPKS